MAEFIWVASYPKSGCTWMRFIVTHLLFGDENGVPNVRDAVPDMHDYRGPLEYSWNGAYPVKTHLCPEKLPPRMHTRVAIHLMRHPLDVVDSALAYLKPETETQREDLINAFCNVGSIEPWYKILDYGSWQGNLASWLEKDHDFPILSLKYEDMLENAHENVRKVADFLSVDANEKRVDDIVQATSFSSMRSQEEKQKEKQDAGVFSIEQGFNKPEFRFMRSGKSGTYKDNLSELEIERLTEGFRPAMEIHGYL